MGIGTAANTHRMFDTVEHHHLDSLVYWATGDFPDAGLNIIGCADGRWFVEVDHGESYNHIEGVSKPNIAPYIEPAFLSDKENAYKFAIECIKTVYPELRDRNLGELFEDED